MRSVVASITTVSQLRIKNLALNAEFDNHLREKTVIFIYLECPVANMEIV
jgi:hypothetical protein